MDEVNRYKLDSPAQTQTQQKNQPLTSFKAGPIRATVWENQSTLENGGTFNTISLDRSYKDKNGTWQKSSTLRINDLPRAAVVLNKAYEYLILNQNTVES